MRIRWDPKGARFPAFHGKYVLYANQGQLLIRSWPRKRGPSKSAAVRRQVAWFKDANRLAKHCAASQQVSAIEMTKGTGLYPRDLLLKCMSAGIIVPVTADGRELQFRRPRVEPVEFQGFSLALTANWTIGVGPTGAPDWPLPLRDTAAFWDVAQPDRITIPPGVTTMVFFLGGNSPAVWNGNLVGIIEEVGGTVYARTDNTGTSQHSLTVSSGPIPVVAGEQYKANYNFTSNGILRGNHTTSFGGLILGAG